MRNCITDLFNNFCKDVDLGGIDANKAVTWAETAISTGNRLLSFYEGSSEADFVPQKLDDGSYSVAPKIGASATVAQLQSAMAFFSGVYGESSAKKLLSEEEEICRDSCIETILNILMHLQRLKTQKHLDKRTKETGSGQDFAVRAAAKARKDAEKIEMDGEYNTLNDEGNNFITPPKREKDNGKRSPREGSESETSGRKKSKVTSLTALSNAKEKQATSMVEVARIDADQKEKDRELRRQELELEKERLKAQQDAHKEQTKFNETILTSLMRLIESQKK